MTIHHISASQNFCVSRQNPANSSAQRFETGVVISYFSQVDTLIVRLNLRNGFITTSTQLQLLSCYHIHTKIYCVKREDHRSCLSVILRIEVQY